jgi:hypothetical protein
VAQAEVASQGGEKELLTEEIAALREQRAELEAALAGERAGRAEDASREEEAIFREIVI